MWRFSASMSCTMCSIVESFEESNRTGFVSRGAHHHLGMHRHQVEHDAAARGVADNVDRLGAEVPDEGGQVAGVLSDTPRALSIGAPTVTSPIPGHHLEAISESIRQRPPGPTIGQSTMGEDDSLPCPGSLEVQLDPVRGSRWPSQPSFR